ncbi:B49 [miniopterid betaherpesvirus 1]|uniref:B49 n=1 Tax=miniopterid betaherpesvirus 1 TaxID=3070189 RepID=I3VQ36_9BETA|nr:B49 [miniopterid betaherpesvirus 1]AFK83880.1 B49 [miniopterid betaherpesvirus 1]
MPSRLRKSVCLLMGQLCRHDDGYHLELFLTGLTNGDGAESEHANPENARDAGSSAAAASAATPAASGGVCFSATGSRSTDNRPSSTMAVERPDGTCCVLNMFVTNKKFLSRELTDKMYYKFSGIWLNCDSGRRDGLSFQFKRIIMTKSFFVFLAYVYLIHCLHEVSSVVSLVGLTRTTWSETEARLCSYPPDRFEAMLDNMNLQHLNDLHRYVFGVEFRIPFPNQTSSPCIPLLRSKEYELEFDVPVLYEGSWRRRHPLAIGAHASSSLGEALRRRADCNPCGNPMYTMAKVIVERFCRTEAAYLIPVRVARASAEQNGRACGYAPRQLTDVEPRSLTKIISFALSVSLRNGLIGSLINLPVTCYCKTKCERYFVPGNLIAIVCKNCGHCLNLGKEKLHCGNGFSLNSMFYYRDRQEKSVIYSTHNESVHCSLCGSQYLSAEPTYEVRESSWCGASVCNVSWKAVTGSNSACTVYGKKSEFDVIVPCSSRTCYSTVVLRDVSTSRLLRLVSHSNDFACQFCHNVYRETCVDDETCDSPCRGCVVFLRFGCGRYRETIADNVN